MSGGEGGEVISDEVDSSQMMMRFPWSSPSTSEPSSPTAPLPRSTIPSPFTSSGHKRSFSGNILSKLNFLRSANEHGRTPSQSNQPQRPESSDGSSVKSRKSIDDDTSSAKGESAMTAALKAGRTRKRKGSLRKTALLGGRRIGIDGRERRNSLLRSSSLKQSAQQNPHPPPATGQVDGATSSTIDGPSSNIRREFSHESIGSTTTESTCWPESDAASPSRLSLVTDAQPRKVHSLSDSQSSPLDLKSPLSNDTSTTDEEDILTFNRPANSSLMAPGAIISLNKPLSSAATSYFPSVSQVPLTRASSKVRRSPLSHAISSSSLTFEIEPHDYTETEYWGWVILFVTWLTFTVGMGSCLEIWSWAWDVGETPYAPPELEDDPTLPIVGYYPALIVLTGVVAWCWITVAWVGMKYFRHAKIEV